MNDKCVDTEVHSISRRGILAFTAAAVALPFAITFPEVAGLVEQ
jgi:hypothetical protein